MMPRKGRPPKKDTYDEGASAWPVMPAKACLGLFHGWTDGRTLSMRLHVVPVLLFLFLAPLVHADAWYGKTVGVSDGDTISVLHNGKAERIRLHGIDCPETGQAFGTKAKQFTSSLAYGKEVLVTVTDTDRYGRTVGIVTLSGGRCLNHELVRAGLAWWYREYASNDAALQQLETQAKAAQAGLWAEPNPVAPWDFRRGDKSSEPAADEPAPAPAAGSAAGRAPPASGALGADATIDLTATGKKFHRDGCTYLSKSNIPTTVADAVARGYEPCLRCRPAPPADGTEVLEADSKTLRLKGDGRRDPNFVPAPPKPTPKPQPAPTYVIPTGPAQLNQTQLTPVDPRGVGAGLPMGPTTPGAAYGAQGGGDTVYVTNTGKKYHRGGCRYLAQSQRAVSRQEAQQAGYGACSVCRP
jgi:micrococcal nuclease